MAKRFLTHVDLTGNQILNSAFEKSLGTPSGTDFEGRMYYDTGLNIVRVYVDSGWVDSGIPIVSSDPVSGNYEGRIVYNTTADSIKFYNGSSWDGVGAGSITSISNSDGNIDISGTTAVTVDLAAEIDADTTGNAATASKWATARTVTFATGDVTGSFSIDGSADVDNVALTIAANSVALGTDTTGNYVAGVSAGSGISVSGSGSEGATVTVTNNDKGSSQNIFKNFAVSGSDTVVADSNDDTLTFVGSNGVGIVSNAGTDYIEIYNSDRGSAQEIFKTIAVAGQSDIVADSNSDTLIVAGGSGITVTTNATTDTLTITNSGPTALSGTTNQITVSNGGVGAVQISLPSAVTFPGTVTLNSDPTQALHAVTKQYVNGIAAGLDWHTAVNLLASSNVALTGTSVTLVIDGHTALGNGDDGYRILLKNQSTASQNGIYVYADDGDTYTLSRATDADAYGELVGAAVFVMEGDSYGTTSWIQTNHYLTDFTGQDWVQFSGSGTYVAGNGLALSGNSFSIDTTVTADLSSTQTLSNKTLTSPTVSGLYLSDNAITVEGTANGFETTVTFTDPTADRTITFKDESGTVAYTADITSAINALSTTDIEEGTNLYYTDERAQDIVFNNISVSNSLAKTYNDAGGTFSLDTTLATTSYMSKSSGLAVDISAVETKLVTDGFPKKYASSIGDGSATSFVLTHSLGTDDVTVQVWSNSTSTRDMVEADIQLGEYSGGSMINTTSKITVSFATAPTSNAYRVVVVG